jgi:hypothetical protein
VTEDAWIAYRGAVALIGDAHEAEERLLRGLRLGKVRSRGVPAFDSPARDANEPVDIEPDHWSAMVFNHKRQSLDRPSFRPIATGFTQIKVSRSDVERLAAPAAIAEQIEEKEVEPERPPRAKAGRRAEHDWGAVELYLKELFDDRGDPYDDPGQVADWYSDEISPAPSWIVSKSTPKRVSGRPPWGR